MKLVVEHVRRAAVKAILKDRKTGRKVAEFADLRDALKILRKVNGTRKSRSMIR